MLGLVGFVPLFGGAGYEQALASGLLLPAAAAVATALDLAPPRGGIPAPLACMGRGLASGAVLAGLGLVTALLHGVRVGVCDLWGGVTFFGLTAGVGSMLGGVWGAVAAEVGWSARRPRFVCVALALAAPLIGIAISVARFYFTPMIFSFDPFFGYFSGALYDTVVDVRTELWTYRAGSAATLAACALLAASLERRAGRLALASSQSRMAPGACLLLSGVAMSVSVAVTLEGPALGHWQSASTIALALGGHASGARCDIVYPDTLFADQVALLVRDCEEELAADERRLGTRLQGRLTMFVFSDARQKRALMGAAETSIAKPWRREVYVQYARYPHPVLGHEIAHVVAGSFSPGPFHVGGGLLPNPGLIEGVAVATSPDDDELTDAQWARAMLDLGILPSARDLFSLAFLGQSAQKSYTVAGAFVAWVLERWGGGTVRAWYGGESIERLSGKSWTALDDDFRGWLATLPMPAEALSYARAKFERPSVWGRKCPHVVDALDGEADRCRDEHRFQRAVALYGSALSKDPTDWRARFHRAVVEMRHGRADLGADELTRIRDDVGAPVTWRDRAAEALADDALARGELEAAAKVYADVASRTLDEDLARTLEVKALAASVGSATGAIVDLLDLARGRPADSFLGALSLGAWAGGSHEPLAEYLAGKNLSVREQWERAALWLDRARADGAPTPRIGRELVRERAIVGCVLGESALLTELRATVAGPDSPFDARQGGRRRWVLSLLDRCAGTPSPVP